MQVLIKLPSTKMTLAGFVESVRDDVVKVRTDKNQLFSFRLPKNGIMRGLRSGFSATVVK